MINPDEFTDYIINQATSELKRNMKYIEELTKNGHSSDTSDENIQTLIKMSTIKVKMEVWHKQLADVFDKHPNFTKQFKYGRYKLTFDDFQEMLSQFEIGIHFLTNKIDEIKIQLSRNVEVSSSSTINSEIDDDLIAREVDELYNLKPARDHPNFLFEMIDQLDLIISKLENMGLDINCPVIEVVIRGKLPVNAVNWIYFEGDGRRAPDWSVKKLLATIRQYAEIRKSAYEFQKSNNPLRRECIFCKVLDHPTNRCPKYSSVSARRDRAQELSLCPHCLKGTKNHRECYIECNICSEKHHCAVCPNK